MRNRLLLAAAVMVCVACGSSQSGGGSVAPPPPAGGQGDAGSPSGGSGSDAGSVGTPDAGSGTDSGGSPDGGSSGSGGGTTVTAEQLTSGEKVQVLALDDQNVYWASYENAGGWRNWHYRIFAQSKSGSVPVPISEGAGAMINWLVARDGFVNWSMATCPVSCDTADYRTHVYRQPNGGKAYFAQSAYSSFDGCIVRANPNGAGATCIDRGKHSYIDVKVDDTHVYFIRDGDVWRLPRQ